MWLDIHDLKNRLKDNPEDIKDLLEFYGYCKIKIHPKEIRCARDEDGDQNSIRVRLTDSLSSCDFVKGIEGDIFSLIMTHKELSFRDVLNDTKKVLGLGNIQKRKVVSTFGGMFNRLSKVKETEQDIKTYNEDILDEYEKVWNTRFLKDGISPRVQKIFKIGYDLATDRISVPWYTTKGELCGVMGRLNYEDSEKPKWFPIIAFSKSFALYGFSENYGFIAENDTIYIGESEKFVLQLATMGYRNAVALGGSNITENQIQYIMSTNPKRIVMCWDEGLETEIIKSNLAKFKDYMRFKEFELCVILDTKNKFLPKGSKASPSDFGKEVFDNLTNECLRKIGGR